ncbi:MAG TPA: hypothetical protein VKS81_11725 [Bacteroidota bacterium]|nr:hypothetical protein [Bacteroidota bacterium]
MGKIVFTISYEVKPEKRADYLSLAKDMQSHLSGQKGKNYAIYEDKNKKNSFSEIYTCSSMEEYDSLEDEQDELTTQLIGKLEDLIVGGKMKYSTLFEVND